MIPYGKHYIDEADIGAVVDLLRGKPLTQGPAIDAFEKAIASYVGARYAVAVASATAGLHLAAIAAGVGPGKTLITSPITFVASANAALYCGGQVAFADIDAETINMCPRSLQAIMAKTKMCKLLSPCTLLGFPVICPRSRKLLMSLGRWS